MPGRKNASAWSDSDPPDDSAQRTNTQPMPIPKRALKTYCMVLFCTSRTTSASPAMARLATRAAWSSFVGSQTALKTIPGIAASSMPRLPPSDDASWCRISASTVSTPIFSAASVVSEWSSSSLPGFATA